MAERTRPILILGAQAVGKKLVLEIINASPVVRGKALFQSAPLTQLLTAERFIVVSRTLAARSLYRRDHDRAGLPQITLPMCEAKVAAGIAQVEQHVEGAEVFRIDYRDLVESTQTTIERLAVWLNVPAWSIGFDIYDADEGLSGADH